MVGDRRAHPKGHNQRGTGKHPNGHTQRGTGKHPKGHTQRGTDMPSEGAAPEGVTPSGTGEPEGGNGVGRGQVAEIQRARMLTAMVQEVAERGAGNVSVGHVVGRSGVSRRTFYEIFDGREDCFLAAFDEAVERTARVVVPAYELSGSWRARMRGALTALLESLEYDSAMGRLLIAESLAAGPKALSGARACSSKSSPLSSRDVPKAKRVPIHQR